MLLKTGYTACQSLYELVDAHANLARELDDIKCAYTLALATVDVGCRSAAPAVIGCKPPQRVTRLVSTRSRSS